VAKRIIQVVGTLIGLGSLLAIGAWANEQDTHKETSEQILDRLQRDLREREISDAVREAEEKKFDKIIKSCMENTGKTRAECKEIFR
jgi:hypothetical protein